MKLPHHVADVDVCVRWGKKSEVHVATQNRIAGMDDSFVCSQKRIEAQERIEELLHCKTLGVFKCTGRFLAQEVIERSERLSLPPVPHFAPGQVGPSLRRSERQ